MLVFSKKAFLKSRSGKSNKRKLQKHLDILDGKEVLFDFDDNNAIGRDGTIYGYIDYDCPVKAGEFVPGYGYSKEETVSFTLWPVMPEWTVYSPDIGTSKVEHEQITLF